MKIFFAYTFLLFVCQCTAMDPGKVFKYTSNEHVPEYIHLHYEQDSLVSGKYYGVDSSGKLKLYYVADLVFESKSKEHLKFSTGNYMFSEAILTPYTDKNKFLPDDKVPANFKMGMNFWGSMSQDERLVLNRTKWYYDSRADEMIFSLEKK